MDSTNSFTNKAVSKLTGSELTTGSDSPTGGLTPCAGRCSTVFGDMVCRGCRRYSQEIIDWNTYTPEQQTLIWRRLDQQLDQLIIPLIKIQNAYLWQIYKQQSVLKLPANASEGRWRYEVFKQCVKQPNLLPSTGLKISAEQLRPMWHNIERQLLALATAMYELSWVRAAKMGRLE